MCPHGCSQKEQVPQKLWDQISIHHSEHVFMEKDVRTFLILYRNKITVSPHPHQPFQVAQNLLLHSTYQINSFEGAEVTYTLFGANTEASPQELSSPCHFPCPSKGCSPTQAAGIGPLQNMLWSDRKIGFAEPHARARKRSQLNPGERELKK